MPSYTVEHAEERIIHVKIIPGYDFEMDAPSLQKQVASLLDKIGKKPVYLVTDFSGINMSFTDIVLALGNNTGGREGSISDQRVKNVFVGRDELVDLAAQSLLQTQYGKVPTLVFTTVSEAFIYARAMLG